MLQTIILAAGQGTRMRSSLAKVLHPLAGNPMIRYPVNAAAALGATRIVVVVGHQGEKVCREIDGIPGVTAVFQTEQNGTGHAVLCAQDACERGGTVLILCGDVPLIRSETLQNFLRHHHESGATVTVMTTKVADPTGYGRIITREEGIIVRIVEEKDATPQEREITQVNTGIYAVDAPFLFDAVRNLGNDNAQREYYLTDIVTIARQQGLPVRAHLVPDPEEVMGINDREQLSHAERVIRERTNRRLMKEGVTIIDPAATHIHPSVEIGEDTVIHPACTITGTTRIGSGCVIEQNVVISDSTIGDGCWIKASSYIEGSTVGSRVTIGPMAHLRPDTILGDEVKIGNFVETKKIRMGRGSKASHLTYLGDAEIGSDVNIGCGTITCNYDGTRKHQTVIGDRVFVGSDVQFVAPVTVGEGSLIAAGTTVTKDVPPDSLAIARSPQINKEGWTLRKRENN